MYDADAPEGKEGAYVLITRAPSGMDISKNALARRRFASVDDPYKKTGTSAWGEGVLVGGTEPDALVRCAPAAPLCLWHWQAFGTFPSQCATQGVCRRLNFASLLLGCASDTTSRSLHWMSGYVHILHYMQL